MRKGVISSIIALSTITLTSCSFLKNEIQENKGDLQVFFTKIPLNNEICIGENFQLEADVLNYEEDNTVYFESLDPSIISVSTNGVIEGMSVGQTTIYAVSNENELKNAGINISVKEALPGDNISVLLNQNEVTLNEEESFQLIATVENFVESNEVRWTSSDYSICEVNNGIITGIKEGSATITATSVENSSKFATCNVTVNKKAEEIFVTINNPTKISLSLGETLQLSAVVSNTLNQEVSWSSSDSSVISVSQNGLIKGESVGEATITATSKEDTSKSYSLRFICVDSIHGYDLVWIDDFKGNELNESYWNYQEGDGSQYGIPGWGNDEAQYYRKENVSVSDGTLKITLKSESYNGFEYTSARIRTNGKVAKTYGRIEARIKLPAVTGAWPAFWMLPDTSNYGGWPNSGEIDIMEVRGRLPYETTSALHYATASGSHEYVSGTGYYDVDNGESIRDFHIYAVEWDEHQFRYYLDDNNFFTVNSWSITNVGPSTTAPFDRDFHILLNLACGGHFDGYRNPVPNNLPAVMEVDYVKWYQ